MDAAHSSARDWDGQINHRAKAGLPLVYGIALQLVPERPESALRIAESTFELLSIKWRRVAKGSSAGVRLANLPIWLMRAAIAVSLRERKRLRLKKPARGSPPAAYLLLFKHFFRLDKTSQRCVMLFHILKYPPASDSARLAKYQKRGEKSVRRLSRKVRKTSLAPEISSALAAIITAPPPEIEAVVLENIQLRTDVSPRSELTRDTIVGWRWLAIRTFVRRVLATVGAIVCLCAILFFTFVQLAQSGRLNSFFIRKEGKNLLKEIPGLAQSARPWPVSVEDKALVRTGFPRTAADLYQATNIWLARLSFTEENWKAIQPVNIPPVPNMMNNGKLILRNPKAQRSGLSGVVGFDFNWVEAQLEFAGAHFTNVAARYRGNGTFLRSLYGPKQSFKIDLNKYTKKQALAGIDELNFVNSLPDSSYVHDAMAQRLFRDLGVPGPRTAYAYLSVDVPGKWTNQALGLYCLIENIDKDFAEDRFGTKKVPIFKPVTHDLFDDLGSDWTDYADIYDLKTDATPEQLQRIVDFAHLVTHTSDEEFARRLPEFLDLEQFAAFVVGHVLTSSYDGFFTNGQNYFMYLHPESNKLGFISWDQDHGWGEFGYVARSEEREQASIWKPWVQQYDFRFLKRTMAVPAFREVYQRKLESALDTLFVKDRLYAQIDQLAAVIRPAVAAESDFRLDRFNKAVSSEYLDGPRDGHAEAPKSPIHQIKRFIENRIISIRAQLAGESEGIHLSRRF